MPKLKDLLPKNIFSNNATKDTANTRTNNEPSDTGLLETDALPVGDTPNDGSNEQPTSINNTPSASVELTESVVRELSDPNYNSLEVVSTGGSTALDNNSNSSSAGALSVPSTGAGAAALAGGATLNTMNVHNAQQQLVMQFSNINKLHFGSVYNFNSNLSANANNLTRSSSCLDEGTSGGAVAADGKRHMPRKTTSIVAMMQSQAEPSHRMLDTVATHLGEGWKAVMRDLGHSEGQIEQAVIDHQMHGGIKEVIYQLLLQWVRGADDGVATLGYLTTRLWESNYREVVQRMKLVYKAEMDRKNAKLQSKQ